MGEFSWSRAGGIFSAGYVKRISEPLVEGLFKNPTFVGLLRSHPALRMSLEALLNFLRAVVDQKLGNDSFIAGFLETVLMDGLGESLSQLIKAARSDLRETAASGNDPRVVAHSNRLLSLDDTLLANVLLAIGDLDERDRAIFNDYMADASDAEFHRFAALSSQQQATLLGLKSMKSNAKGGGWLPALKTFGRDFFAVTATFFKWSRDLGLDVMFRYFSAVLWVFKSAGTTIGMAFMACVAAGTLKQGALVGALVGLGTLGVALVLIGRAQRLSWLSAAGALSAAVAFLAAALVAGGFSDSVFSIIFMFLIGIPILAIISVLLPLSMFLEALRAVPGGLKFILRPMQVVFAAAFGILLFSALLLVIPTPNPVVFIFMLVTVGILTLAAGLGFSKLGVERMFSTSFLAAAGIFLVLVLVLASLPNLRYRIAKPFRSGTLVGGTPTVLIFDASKDVTFVSPQGEALIWYAERPEGGFDLFKCEGVGPYFTGDGRKLALAGDAAIRLKISTWIDLDAAKRALDRAGQQKAAKEQEVAGYLAVHELADKADYLICAVGARGEQLEGFSGDLALSKQARGKTALGSAFTGQFYPGGFESIFGGGGGDLVKAMRLKEMGPRLVMVKLQSFNVSEKAPGAHGRLYMAEAKALFHVIDTNNGGTLEDFSIAAKGLGQSSQFAKAEAVRVLVDKFGQRAL